MKWIEEFETKFLIKKTDNSKPFLIIEGECKYTQKLGDIYLALKINNEVKNFFNSNKCTVYDNFDVVAFLVSDWIKIQDSLEMVFNLMTGSSERALKVLSYLRSKQIPAHEFALYLYSFHKVILVNRFTSNTNGTDRKSKLSEIKKIIKSIEFDCHYLIVGDRNHLSISNIDSVKELGKVLHPSGVVLNIYPEEYFCTWYLLDNDSCIFKTNGFSLSSFQRI